MSTGVTPTFYVHGGQGQITFFDDLWSFNTQAEAWRLETPAGVAPRARAVHGGAFDQTNEMLYISGGRRFGGFDEPGNDDLWACSVHGNNWTQMETRDNRLPGPRGDHAAAFDSGSSTLFFHGAFWAGGGGVKYELADIWAFRHPSGANTVEGFWRISVNGCMTDGECISPTTTR